MYYPVKVLLCMLLLAGNISQAKSTPVIHVNQVGFDTKDSKIAVLQTGKQLKGKNSFSIIDVHSNKNVFSAAIAAAVKIEEWSPGELFYQLDFSAFQTAGRYSIRIQINDSTYSSPDFIIEENALAKNTLSAIVHYYNKQRANTPEEINADKNMLLHDSSKRVDVHGGWCDASGDVSKYFSHLAYANFVSPQQTPLVTWSLINTSESIPALLSQWNLQDSLDAEALWGADYLMRSLSADDYFYMIVFSYFNKDPNARRIVGLLANSVTTNDYQCAFREGGGMAIAALARISQWKKHGDFTSQQYLDGAKRAFKHLLVNNTKYDDDGRENIIDDYCALMAATELWIATNDSEYGDEARKRAQRLEKRLTPAGWFLSDDGRRPFWHAADAGMPIVAMTRYLDKETNSTAISAAINMIQKALAYNIAITNKIANPFGYARQTFSLHNKIQDGFFIPHENETGWWWQGENARLGSLAAAAIQGGKIIGGPVKQSLEKYAGQQLSWILGCNPYSMCFLYGFGKNNVPYMHSNYGHGSERGGISNGITGKDGMTDGSGIDFKTSAEGNEWRWTEQWIPHAAWFLQAITAMAKKN